MTTKPLGAELNFLSPTRSKNGGPNFLSILKAIVESFSEGRTAEARYREHVARGLSHEQAARKVFDLTYSKG